MRAKRLISVVLVLCIIFSSFCHVVYAADTNDFVLGNIVIASDMTEDITVKVPFKTNKDYAMQSFEATFSSESTYVTLVGFEHDDRITIGTNDEENLDTGHVLWTHPSNEDLSFSKNSTIWTAIFEVSKDAPQNQALPVRMDLTCITDYMSNDYLEEATYTATITVEEPAEPTADYEVWYTLEPKTESETDADGNAAPDGYKEVEVGDTVTATFFLRNNATDTYLQAYDVYMTHSKHLTAAAVADATVEVFTGDAVTTDDIKETHLQFAADNSNAQEIKNGDVVALGTVTFTVEDSAVYGEGMDITILPGSAEDGDETTNIAIGKVYEANTLQSVYQDTGDKQSYYPGVINKVTEDDVEVTYKGVEITNTYTVKYDANGGTGAPADEVKGHNVAHTLSTTKPTYNGYNFLGWSADKTNVITTLTADVNQEPITVYAVWDANEYSITFDSDGGSEVESITANCGEAITKPADPTRTGYDFAGWDSDNDGAEDEFPTTMPAGGLNLKALWTIKQFTITFNTDGGSTIAPITKDYNTEITAPAAPEKEGYTFKGWKNAENNEVTFPFYMPAENMTLTAQWQVNQYTIRFVDTDDRTIYEYTLDYNAAVTTPAEPTKTGYDFVKWDKDIPAKMPAEDVTITATWTPIQYTITFNLGEGETLVGTNAATVTYDIEDAVTLPDASKAGVNFAGWKASSTETNNWNANSYKNTVGTGMYGNVTLTAIWTSKDFTITDGSVTNGTVSAENEDGVSGKTANKDEFVTVTVDPADGYTLVNGSVKYTVTSGSGNGTTENIPVTSDGNGKYTGTFEMPNGNVEVTAEFVGIDYTIEFNSNEGEGEVADVPAKYGETVTLPTTGFTKEGYKFIGWSTAADNTAEYPLPTDGSAFTATNIMVPTEGGENTVTLYAVWEAVPYTVTTQSGGNGTVSAVPNENVTFGTEVLLTVTPAEGYEIDTLTYTKENDTVAVEIVDNKFNMPAANVTVYATFKLADYDVVVDTMEHGSVTTDAVDGMAHMGQVVNLTITPDEGYEIDTLTYTAEGGEQSINIENNKFTMPAANVTVQATFKLKTLTVTVSDEIDTTKGSVTAPANAKMGDVVTLTVTSNPGYEIAVTVTDAKGGNVPVADNKFTMPSTEVTVNAAFTAKQYTITFDLDEGTMPAEDTWKGNAVYDAGTGALTYTIESTAKLPLPTKTGYTFDGWFVVNESDKEASVGAWGKHDTKHNAADAVAGYYESVKLLAKWTQNATYLVQQYGYANEVGLSMLIVPNDLVNGNDGTVYEYKFGEGENAQSMYFLEDTAEGSTHYGSTGNGVFYLLIDSDYIGNDGKLTSDGYELLTSGAAVDNKRATVAYNGDINDDGVLNIADANVVYQMITTGDAYYSIDSVTEYDRLHADMVKEVYGNDHRASIADVNKIVNMINGVTG